MTLEEINKNSFYCLSQFDFIEMHQQIAEVFISVNQSNIYHEILYAGATGNVIIEDLYSLFLPYFNFSESGTLPLNVKINVVNYMTAEFTLYYSDRVSSFEFNSYFDRESPFLSFVKNILPNEVFRLPFFVEYDIQFDIKIVTNLSKYSLRDGIQVPINNRFYSYDVSPKVLADKLKLDKMFEHIVSIQIVDECEHSFFFIVDYSNPDIAGNFAYIDNLGFTRTISIPGVIIRKSSVENNVHQLDSKLILAAKNFDLSFEVKTAILDSEKEKELRSIFLSPKVWFDINGVFNEVIIDDINDDAYSSPDNLYSAEFSFKLCNTNIKYL